MYGQGQGQSQIQVIGSQQVYDYDYGGQRQQQQQVIQMPINPKYQVSAKMQIQDYDQQTPEYHCYQHQQPIKTRKRSKHSRIADEIISRYTDVHALSFSPDGSRLSFGTFIGKFSTIIRDHEANEAFLETHGALPDETPIRDMLWRGDKLIIASKDCLRMYDPSYFEKDQEEYYISASNSKPSFVRQTLTEYDVQGSDVLSIVLSHNNSHIFAACHDSKVRAFDIETRKNINKILDHRDSVTAINSNSEYLATGGKDGKVYVYDASFRTNKPVTSFDFNKNPISGVSISKYSTWLAVSVNGTPSPNVFSLKNGQKLPAISIGPYSSRFRHRIHKSLFDSKDDLLWGGEGGILYKSELLEKADVAMQAKYGNGEICHIYSIATTQEGRICIGGASNTLLFSDNGRYWDAVIKF